MKEITTDLCDELPKIKLYKDEQAEINNRKCQRDEESKKLREDLEAVEPRRGRYKDYATRSRKIEQQTRSLSMKLKAQYGAEA